LHENEKAFVTLGEGYSRNECQETNRGGGIKGTKRNTKKAGVCLFKSTKMWGNQSSFGTMRLFMCNGGVPAGGKGER